MSPEHWQQPADGLVLREDEKVKGAAYDLEYSMIQLFPHGSIVDTGNFTRMGEVIAKHVVTIAEVVVEKMVEHMQRDGRW